MFLEAEVVACLLEPFPQTIDVMYHYGNVFFLVVVCTTVVNVVRLIFSVCLSIVEVAFAVTFVM